MYINIGNVFHQVLHPFFLTNVQYKCTCTLAGTHLAFNSLCPTFSLLPLSHMP